MDSQSNNQFYDQNPFLFLFPALLYTFRFNIFSLQNGPPSRFESKAILYLFFSLNKNWMLGLTLSRKPAQEVRIVQVMLKRSLIPLRANVGIFTWPIKLMDGVGSETVNCSIIIWIWTARIYIIYSGRSNWQPQLGISVAIEWILVYTVLWEAKHSNLCHHQETLSQDS